MKKIKLQFINMKTMNIIVNVQLCIQSRDFCIQPQLSLRLDTKVTRLVTHAGEAEVS